MEITGKVIAVLPLQQGVSQSTGKAWMIQPFVIETIENYPKKVCIELSNEKSIKDNPVKENTTVTVSYDLESREWNSRWYTSVRAWKVVTNGGGIAQEVVAAAANLQPQPPQQPTFDAVGFAPQAPNVAEGGDPNGLPF